MKGFTMFTLIAAAIVVFCLYKMFTAKPSTKTQEEAANLTLDTVPAEEPVVEVETNPVKVAVSTLKTEMTPVKEAVITATNAAKTSYDQARRQQLIAKLMEDPELVDTLVAARIQVELEKQNS